MKSTISSAVAEVMAAAVIANRADFTVFVRFSGHICNLEVQVHFGGWADNKEMESLSAYVEDGFCECLSEDDLITRIYSLRDFIVAASIRNEERKTALAAAREAERRQQYEALKAEYEANPATSAQEVA